MGFYLLAIGAVKPRKEQWIVIAPATAIGAVRVASGWIHYPTGHWSE